MSTVDVVHDESGAIIALSFAPPVRAGTTEPRSGFVPGEGQTATRLELPPDLTIGHDTLSRLVVETPEGKPRLVLR